MSAGWIAGGVLFLVYAMLTFIGVSAGARFGAAANGTETLTGIVSFLFGKAGALILAVIFVIACFNTCVSLLSCCGKYFQEVFPRVGYTGWLLIFALISVLIANAGLDAILKVSCVQRLLGRYPAVYPTAALLCGAASVVSVLDAQGVQLPVLTGVLRRLPAYGAGFGWLIPTLAGIAVGVLISVGRGRALKSR